MNYRDIIINLGEQLAAENNALNDLWTWLPSFAHAHQVYGDYVFDHRPSVEDLVQESAKVFWVIKNGYINPAEAMAWFCSQDALEREAFTDDRWSLEDIQAFFKRQYGADMALWRGQKAEAG